MLTLLTNMPRDVLITQLQDGLILLVLGLGTVFVFLTVLIGATTLMSKVCAKIAPQKVASATASKRSSTAAPQNSGAKDAEVAVAIAAAYNKSKN